MGAVRGMLALPPGSRKEATALASNLRGCKDHDADYTRLWWVVVVVEEQEDESRRREPRHVLRLGVT